MVHTLPDYTTKYRMATIFGQIDSGELAARLGALSTKDRRGNLVWFDDFEGTPENWVKSWNAGTPTIVKSTTRSHRGSQSFKIVSGAADNNWAGIEKEFPIPSTSKYGLEFYFWIADDAAQVLFYFDGFDGANMYRGVVKFLTADTSLHYLTSAAAWVELGSGYRIHADDEIWQNLKIVVDWTTKEYVRVIFNGDVFPLPGVAMYTASAATTDKHLHNLINITALEDAAKTMYVDDFIFTQNET